MQSDNELEQLLRKAPAPPAPFGLEQRLVRQAARPRRAEQPAWTWFSVFRERNWAPALALSIVLIGLLTALAFQQNSLTELKQAQKNLAGQLPAPGSDSQSQGNDSLEREFQQLQKQSAELQELRAEMAEIEQLLPRQPQLAAQNAALRAELSSLTKDNPELSPELQAALDQGRKKADRIRCVNNLKNVGLGARIWAVDNTQHLPDGFLAMKNELSTPKILICPSDPSRSQAVNTWEQFATLGASYELLSPGISQEVFSAVYARCPVHNNVVLADGSVHQLGPDQQLLQRDGHWELKK